VSITETASGIAKETGLDDVQVGDMEVVVKSFQWKIINSITFSTGKFRKTKC
jgi:hypothetical protein